MPPVQHMLQRLKINKLAKTSANMSEKMTILCRKIICVFVKYSLLTATQSVIRKSAFATNGFTIEDKHAIKIFVSEMYGAKHVHKMFPGRG